LPPTPPNSPVLGCQIDPKLKARLADLVVEPIGKLRALAVTSAMRSDALPDVPTLGEFVPGYEATAWFGMGAPKNTPAEIVDKLNSEINAGLAP
jgi:hypothetical protein